MYGGRVHEHAARRGDDRRRLAVALGVTFTVLVVEMVGAAFTGSLALLADAGHLATDVLGLAAALGAAMLARRPPSVRRTFGLGRAEVLAAALNAVILLGVGGVVAVQAVRRLMEPVGVPGVPLLMLGAIGLAGNLVALAVLAGGDRASLNLRGALLEVAGDVLGSVAVLAAAAVMLTTGWERADPVASLLIAALIVPRAVMLLRDAGHVLLEGAPAGLDIDAVRAALLDVPGVTDVHDLHIWTITSGFPSLSAHVLVAPAADCHGIRLQLEHLLAERFGLTHTTLQVEHAVPQRVELTTRTPR